MSSPEIKSSYTQDDFESLGFHDCYVHGLRWSRRHFSLILDIDYIVQWVETGGKYQFWVSPSELCFRSVSDAVVSLDWTQLAPECQIEGIYRRETRTTANGTQDYHWDVEFGTPDGSIDLWATEFELRIQSVPVLCQTPHLRQKGEV